MSLSKPVRDGPSPSKIENVSVVNYMKLFLNSPLQPWNVAKLLIHFLLKCFDKNRLLYCLFVFPIYQMLSFVGIAVIISLTLDFDGSLKMYFALFLSTIFVGFPILVTWHLSCCLFGKAYFEFLGVHKWPLSGLILGPMYWFIELYR